MPALVEMAMATMAGGLSGCEEQKECRSTRRKSVRLHGWYNRIC